MATMANIIKDVKNTSALASDGDGTLWEGKWVYGGLAYRQLKDDILNHNYLRVSKEIVGMVRIKNLLRKNSGRDTAADVDGLRLLYAIMAKNGIGNKDQMASYALEYFKTHTISDVNEIIRAAPQMKILVTQGGSTGAEVARRHFGFEKSISNIDRFDESGKLKGIDLVMRDGEAKLILTSITMRNMGVKLSESTAIVGDGLADIPMLMEAKVRIASPYAKPEVNALPKIIHLADFMI
jgi:phosphoserine phosphatase